MVIEDPVSFDPGGEVERDLRNELVSRGAATAPNPFELAYDVVRCFLAAPSVPVSRPPMLFGGQRRPRGCLTSCAMKPDRGTQECNQDRDGAMSMRFHWGDVLRSVPRSGAARERLHGFLVVPLGDEDLSRASDALDTRSMSTRTWCPSGDGTGSPSKPSV